MQKLKDANMLLLLVFLIFYVFICLFNTTIIFHLRCTVSGGSFGCNPTCTSMLTYMHVISTDSK